MNLLDIILMVCVIAAGITAAVPAPAGGVLAVVWKVLNLAALNVGNARNAASAARTATEPIAPTK